MNGTFYHEAMGVLEWEDREYLEIWGMYQWPKKCRHMFSDFQCIKETVLRKKKKRQHGKLDLQFSGHLAGPDEGVGVGGQGWLRQASETANADDAKGQGP